MEAFAVDALAAPEVQRLRRIRQLGLVSLVFPGAEHSRFAHSLGAAHVMSRFSRSLRELPYLPSSIRPGEALERDLVLAALCHDLGHGPLSHAWEQQVVKGFDRKAWMVSLGLTQSEAQPRQWLDRPKLAWHELVTQALILSPQSELNQMLENLERGTSERVAALVGGTFAYRYLATAFSSDVDVDRCDFILRDARQTGVAHGRYDLDWLVSTLAVGVSGSDEPVLGFDLAKAPRVIEQLLIARRALYDTVYHHRAVRAAEGMVGLLLDQVHSFLGESGNELPVEGFDALAAGISGSPLTVAQVLELDDESLAVFIRRLAELDVANAPAIPRLARMFLRRELFKPVPVGPVELTRTAYEDDGALASIDRTLERGGYSPGRSFRFLDEAEFSFFHSDNVNEGSWLVDLSSTQRAATPIRLHHTLVHHEEKRRMTQLYVPRDVVFEVASVLSP